MVLMGDEDVDRSPVGRREGGALQRGVVAGVLSDRRQRGQELGHVVVALRAGDEAEPEAGRQTTHAANARRTRSIATRSRLVIRQLREFAMTASTRSASRRAASAWPTRS